MSLSAGLTCPSLPDLHVPLCRTRMSFSARLACPSQPDPNISQSMSLPAPPCLLSPTLLPPRCRYLTLPPCRYLPLFPCLPAITYPSLLVCHCLPLSFCRYLPLPPSVISCSSLLPSLLPLPAPTKVPEGGAGRVASSVVVVVDTSSRG